MTTTASPSTVTSSIGFADDTAKRFEGYGWNVIRGIDGHDVAAVDAAIKQARSQSAKPTLICRTVIGKGSPNMAGTHNVHGAPLGKDEIAATRAALGWSAEPFQIRKPSTTAGTAASRAPPPRPNGNRRSTPMPPNSPPRLLNSSAA